MKNLEKLLPYISLLRLDKPIGILLLLWPTWWALWLANEEGPTYKNLFIFTLGVFLMRSAGCVINDFADRQVDGYVNRTKNRPLATKKISTFAALWLVVLLIFAAFVLVLFCNQLTIQLAFVGAALTLFYPFLKRFTFFPQVGLGLAFAWGVPMAFAAERNAIDQDGWLLFAVAVIWPIIYDTMYAMVDREDDLKIGVKSTAILFAELDLLIIGLLQILFLSMLVVVGHLFHLHFIFYGSVGLVSVFFIYQQWLLSSRDEVNYFKAFLNNNWVGLVIFLGIYLARGNT